MEQNIFGILIPGKPPITSFENINNMLVYDLQNPIQVSQITFFKMVELPPDQCGVLYYSLYPFENLQFIGAVANNWPSDIFNPGFPLLNDLQQHPYLKLVIQIQNMENVKSLVMINNENNIQKEYGKKVAQNLYNFMISFHKEGLIQGGDYLVLPINCLEKWFKKYEDNYNKDPNFIMRTKI